MKLLSVGIPVIWLMLFSVTADIDIEKNYDYKDELNRALNVRTELLSQAYYGEEDCKAGLSEVIAEPMLSQDLENIENNRETDMERVEGFEIKDFQMLSEDEEGAVVRAVIKWKIEGEKDYAEEGIMGDEYTIIFENSKDGKLRISEMNYEAKIYSPLFFCDL